jgi:hypothetical protein
MDMVSYLALYDPSHVNPEGTYWTWRHKAVPLAVLDGFYYEFAAKRRPDSPNSLAPSDLNGGLIRVSKDWTVVYRFLNGGRDTRSRPERFVLLSAWLDGADAVEADLFSLLDGQIFRDVARIAVNACPVPVPKTLLLELPPRRRGNNYCDIDVLLQKGKLEFIGNDAIEKATRHFLALPVDRMAIANFINFRGVARASIEIITPKTYSFPKPGATNTDQPNTELKINAPRTGYPLTYNVAQNVLVKNPGLILGAVFILGMIVQYSLSLFAASVFPNLWPFSILWSAKPQSPISVPDDSKGRTTARPQMILDDPNKANAPGVPRMAGGQSALVEDKDKPDEHLQGESSGSGPMENPDKSSD